MTEQEAEDVRARGAVECYEDDEDRDTYENAAVIEANGRIAVTTLQAAVSIVLHFGHQEESHKAAMKYLMGLF